MAEVYELTVIVNLDPLRVHEMHYVIRFQINIVFLAINTVI